MQIDTLTVGKFTIRYSAELKMLDLQDALRCGFQSDWIAEIALKEWRRRQCLPMDTTHMQTIAAHQRQLGFEPFELRLAKWTTTGTEHGRPRVLGTPNACAVLLADAMDQRRSYHPDNVGIVEELTPHVETLATFLNDTPTDRYEFEELLATDTQRRAWLAMELRL
jgi:hypothetical protein